MLENWSTEILNSFTRIDNRRISNGPTERVNRHIKTLYRLAYGAKNFYRMRNRIMYVINDDAPILYNRKEETNKYLGREEVNIQKNKKSIFVFVKNGVIHFVCTTPFHFTVLYTSQYL